MHSLFQIYIFKQKKVTGRPNGKLQENSYDKLAIATTMHDWPHVELVL